MAAIVSDESAPASSQTGVFRAEPPLRQRVADHVFESLARAIFAGELEARRTADDAARSGEAVQRVGARRAPGDPSSGRSRARARAPGQHDDRARSERVDRHPLDPVAASSCRSPAPSSPARRSRTRCCSCCRCWCWRSAASPNRSSRVLRYMVEACREDAGRRTCCACRIGVLAARSRRRRATRCSSSRCAGGRR